MIHLFFIQKQTTLYDHVNLQLEPKTVLAVATTKQIPNSVWILVLV